VRSEVLLRVVLDERRWIFWEEQMGIGTWKLSRFIIFRIIHS
jgi:hypothetical protein